MGCLIAIRVPEDCSLRAKIVLRGDCSGRNPVRPLAGPAAGNAAHSWGGRVIPGRREERMFFFEKRTKKLLFFGVFGASGVPP
jgi:hypothetical protein